jgi:hypothetical protein
VVAAAAAALDIPLLDLPALVVAEVLERSSYHNQST